MTASEGLLDTSVIVAMEMLRPLNEALIPERQFISVITLAELRAGVLAASDTETLSRRRRSLDAYSSADVLIVGDAAAEEWARLRYRLVQAGRRVNINDLWIASIAVANDLPVVTQDHDFDPLEDLGGPAVIVV
ncbi:MAG: PIN domain-containing protein [Microbacteriaceae bacterium]|nr:PIN domain-containing protein [Microbacteriaceae bacterium]